jgi:hypothetical protein
MSVFKEAVVELKHALESDAAETVSTLTVKTSAAIEAFYRTNPVLPASMHQNDLAMPDAVQCWTNYEPRTDHSTSLSDAIITQAVVDSYAKGVKDVDEWHVVVADRLHYGDAHFERNRNFGYKDYKVVLVGHQGSGPVSLFFKTVSKGKIMLCDLAQDWGSLQYKGNRAPDMYCRLLKCNPKVFVTPALSSAKPSEFEFNPASANELQFGAYRDVDDCILSSTELKADYAFVLTIVPQTEKRHLISHVIIP